MDPFTICTTVASLVKTCGTAATTCNGLLSKYKNAPQILASIRTECATIKTALSYVDWLVKRDTELLSSQLKANSPLAETLDVALTGCAVTFSLLDIELQKLYDKSKDQDGYKWKDKMRYVWDEDRAKNILDHMRGLQSAVNLVLTALQTSSLSALGSLLQDQKLVIERVRQNTRSIRESRSSQVALTADADRQESSKSYSNFNSSIGDEEFSFDDEIINSLAYRNAIKRLALKSKGTQQSAEPEPHILDQPLIDLEEPPLSQRGPGVVSNAISNHPCLTPISKCIHADLLSDAIVEDLKSLLPTFVGSPTQQTNARLADVEYPAFTGERSDNASDDETENSGDVEKVAGQCISDDTYQEVVESPKPSRKPSRASARPRPRSSQSTSTTTDAMDSLDKNGVPLMTMRRELCSPILSKKTESQPSPLVERRIRANPVVQEVARRLPQVISPSSRSPVSVSGNFGTTYSNVSCIERDDATNRLRRRVERAKGHNPENGGRDEPTSSNNASVDEGSSVSSLVVEYSETNSVTDCKDKTSTDEFTYQKKPSRESRKKERNQHRLRDVTARAISGGIITAAAAHKLHERKSSSSSRDRDLSLPKQKRRRRQVQDHIQDSGIDVALPSHSVPERGAVVASNSITGNAGLREYVEQKIRRLVIPELETMKQEQRTKQKEPSHPDSTSSDGNAPHAVCSHKFSKHVSVPDPSGGLTDFTNRDEKNTYICAEDDAAMDVSRRTDRPSYSIPEDGSPVIVPNSANLSQTSLLIEYLEGGIVKVTPSAARKKDTNEHVQVTSSKDSRKPSYTRRISLGPYSTEERHTTKSTYEKCITSYPSPTEESSLAHQSPPMEIEMMDRDDQDRDQSDPNSARGERYRRSRSRSLSKEKPAQMAVDALTGKPQSNEKRRRRSKSRSLGNKRLTQIAEEDITKKPQSNEKRRR